MKAKFVSEKVLVQMLRSGNEEAFNKLFFKYKRKIYDLSQKTLFSGEDAEEVVQEVFLKIWKNKHILDENQSFSFFLYIVARNIIKNQLSKKVSESTYINYCTKNISGYVNSTEEEYHFQELRKEIQANINCLPEKRKKVFEMSRYDGFSNKEIAEHLKLSLSTVENHLNKALKSLKYHLNSRGINFIRS